MKPYISGSSSQKALSPSSTNKSQTTAMSSSNLLPSPSTTQAQIAATNIAIPKHIINTLNRALSVLNIHLHSKTNGANLIDEALFERALLNNILTLKDQIRAILKPKILTAFPKFSALPIEIRVAVWKLAGGEGKVIGVHAVQVRGELVLGGTAMRCPLLLACTEPRAEVLPTKGNFSTSTPGAPKIYANFGVDTIWIQGQTAANYAVLRDEILKIVSVGDNGAGVQKLAINSKLGYNFRHHFVYDEMLDFVPEASIKELIVVLGDSKQDSGDHLRLAEPAQSFITYVDGLTSGDRHAMRFYGHSDAFSMWEQLELRTREELEREERRLRIFCTETQDSGERGKRIPSELWKFFFPYPPNWVAPRISIKEVVASSTENKGDGQDTN